MPSISEISALLRDALAIAPASATESTTARSQNLSQADSGYGSQQTASAQCIEEIGTRLEAALAFTPTSVPPMESAILSPKSVGSQGLSQVDSGFGSPPAFVDEEEDVEDGFSDVEPLDDTLGADDRGATPSLSKPDGKSCSWFSA